MTVRVPVAAIAPDLRAGLAPALAEPGAQLSVFGAVLRVESCLPASAPVPVYLRYADRDAVVIADTCDSPAELLDCLTRQVNGLAGEAAWIPYLAAAVLALDAVDRAFRDAGLWRGNIYLAGDGALTAVLSLADEDHGRADGSAVLRELAALKLAYLFPVAGKFRDGSYDGQVQYRLNGWGRSLARRLAGSPSGALLARTCYWALAEHLTVSRSQYARFLDGLDVARQGYASDQLAGALALPIPVLV